MTNRRRTEVRVGLSWRKGLQAEVVHETELETGCATDGVVIEGEVTSNVPRAIEAQQPANSIPVTTRSVKHKQ